MNRMIRPGLAGLALALALVAGAFPASAVVPVQDPAVSAVPAGVDDFSFDSLTVDYSLSRAADGTSRLRVVETFVAVFPPTDQNRGMRRAIPDSYNGQPLHPTLVGITDDTGAPRPAEVATEDGVFTMTSRADGYVHGPQTYVFTYDLENVIWDFPATGTEEFYWDVNGVDWAQAFGPVRASVTVPSDLASALTGDRACYAGSQGSTTTCPITTATAPDGAETITASVPALSPYQTLTIAVGFVPGTFALFDSSPFASAWGWLQLLGAAVMAAGLVWTVLVRVRRLHDAPGRPTIIAEYVPPAGIDALTSAVLLKKPAKAIPAEVLEQAIVGSIRIEEGGRKLFGRAKLKAVLVDPSRADGDGRMLLNGLFGGAGPGAEFEFGSRDTRLSQVAQRILKSAAAELRARGIYRTVPASVKVLPGIVVGAGAVMTFLFGVAALNAAVSPLLPVPLMMAAVAAIVVFFWVMAKKPLTEQGAQVRDHLAGLKVFIEWAEADRIRMLQSPQGAERVAVDTADRAQMLKIYEPLLPYAVVFGQEKQWSEHLAVLYGDDGRPDWYVGSGAFNAAAFAAGVATLSASAMSSSSTSGGSGGGGSAGGGGGGGGGGGV
jgi:uncharacterized membrane protein YgcG